MAELDHAGPWKCSLNHQRQTRTHIARKEFNELRRAAISLQSNLRGTPGLLFSCICFLLLPCLVVCDINCMFKLT
jgi:hypothetical protein